MKLRMRIATLLAALLLAAAPVGSAEGGATNEFMLSDIPVVGYALDELSAWYEALPGNRLISIRPVSVWCEEGACSDDVELYDCFVNSYAKGETAKIEYDGAVIAPPEAAEWEDATLFRMYDRVFTGPDEESEANSRIYGVCYLVPEGGARPAAWVYYIMDTEVTDQIA